MIRDPHEDAIFQAEANDTNQRMVLIKLAKKTDISYVYMMKLISRDIKLLSHEARSWHGRLPSATTTLL